MNYSESLPLLLKGKGFKKVIEKRGKTENFDVYEKYGVEVTLYHNSRVVNVALSYPEDLGTNICSLDKLNLLVEALKPSFRTINNEEGD
jgi:hypothetical protein